MTKNTAVHKKNGPSTVPRRSSGKKPVKDKAGRKQQEMAFTAKFDPNVTYHPSMVEQLRKMGITLEAKPQKQNKVPITIRLDPDILAALRSMGDGWQPKTNDLLRKWLKL